MSLGPEHHVIATTRPGRRRRKQGAGQERQGGANLESTSALPRNYGHREIRTSTQRCMFHSCSTIIAGKQVCKNEMRKFENFFPPHVIRDWARQTISNHELTITHRLLLVFGGADKEFPDLVVRRL